MKAQMLALFHGSYMWCLTCFMIPEVDVEKDSINKYIRSVRKGISLKKNITQNYKWILDSIFLNLHLLIQKSIYIYIYIYILFLNGFN